LEATRDQLLATKVCELVDEESAKALAERLIDEYERV
jgi:hypothetical protein